MHCEDPVLFEWNQIASCVSLGLYLRDYSCEMQFKLTTGDNADAFCFCLHFTCSGPWQFRQPPHVWVLENLCAASMPALLAYMSTKWLKTNAKVMVRFHTCHCIYPNNSKMMEVSVLVQICILLSLTSTLAQTSRKPSAGCIPDTTKPCPILVFAMLHWFCLELQETHAWQVGL